MTQYFASQQLKSVTFSKTFEALGQTFHSLKDIIEGPLGKVLPPSIIISLQDLTDDVYKEWRKMAPSKLLVKEGSSNTLRPMILKYREIVEKARNQAYAIILPDTLTWARLVNLYLIQRLVPAYSVSIDLNEAESQILPVFSSISGLIKIDKVTLLFLEYTFSHKTGTDSWWVNVLVKDKGNIISNIRQATDAKYTALDIFNDLTLKGYINH